MADGTVTGEFRLYTVQARRELDRLQREGTKTDETMSKLGHDLDTVGSRKQQRQVRDYRGEVRQLGTTAERARRPVDKLTRSTENLGSAATNAALGGRGGRGGRGGGGGTARGGMFGLSGSMKQVAVMGALALPVVRSLTGAVGALATTLASAAGGAGAVGAAGVVGLVTGLGGIASVAIPAAKAIKEVSDAQEKYNEIVKEYGRRSKEAREARGILSEARRGAPGGTSALVNEARAFGDAWKAATSVGQRSLIAFARNAVRTGKEMTPFLSRLANDMSKAFSIQGNKALDFLQGKRVQKGLAAGAGIFSENLSNVRRIGQATVEMFLNVTRAARPYVREFTTFLRKWFEGRRDKTRNIAELRQSIHGMVEDLKSVGRVGGAGVRLLLALMGAGGTRAGRGLLDDTTDQLNAWTRWVERNPRKIQAFFRESADDARRLASALGSIVDLLWRAGDALRPLLPMIQGAASLANLAGPLMIPGLIGAGRGAVRGVRGGAAGGGVLSMLGGGGAARVAAGAGATGAALAGGGAAAAARGGLFLPSSIERNALRNARAPIVARGLPKPAWTGAQMAGGTTRGTGAASLLRGASPVAKAALAGAGKAFLPIQAALFGLSAAGTEGGIDRKLAGGFASLDPTGLLFKTPKSYADLREEGSDRVGTYRPHGGLTAERGGLAAGQRKLASLQASLTATKSIIRPGMAGARATVDVLSEDEKIARREEIKKLKEENAARGDVIRQLRDERAYKEEERAPGQARGTRRAYRVRRREQGGEAARAGIVDDVMEDFGKKLTNRGRRSVATANLAWLNEQKKKNPKLAEVYDELVEKVKRRFKRMGENVEVINGKVYRSTNAAWRQISKSISGHAEQARQEARESFTKLQKDAVSSLKQMGYSDKAAKEIVTTAEGTGGDLGAAAGARAAGKRGAAQAEAGHRARGGRIRGRGLRDTVPVGDGGMAAPGELIVNRHTEEDHDRDARMLGLPSLGQRVKRERRPHSAPRKVKRNTDVYRARGGRVAALMGASPGLARYAQMGTNFGLQVTSGFRGNSITSSGNVSLHSSGDALDISGGTGQMLAFARAMARRYGSGLDELIHTPLGFGIKNGQRVAPYAAADHYDHVHVGDRSPGGRGGIVVGADGTMALAEPVHLRAPRTKLGGIPGAMSQRAGDSYAKGLSKKINRLSGAGAGGGGAPTKGILSFRQVARIAERAGLPGVTFAQIAKGESGFNPRAVGHDPGGTQGLGLWQITTGYNDDIIERFGGRQAMFNARTNARAAKAIYDRAGIGAWYGTRYMTDPNAHYQGRAKGGRIGNAGWFAKGGSFTTNGPTVFGAGERGKEQVTITPKGKAGGGVTVVINMGSVTVANIEQAGTLGDQIGQRVAAKVASALREAAVA